MRTYVESAKRVSARRLGGALPDLPFAVWLHQIAETRGGRVEDAWRIAHCDEFSIESALPPRTRDLCTVAYVAIEGAWAEVWLRTGRVELGEREVRWLSETPSYEGMRLHGSFAVEPPAGLPALSDLLAVPPAGWPSADLSIAPGDIEVTSALDQVRVSAVIRNSGNANARNAYVDITVSTGQDRGIRRGFVIDVPGGSSTQVEGPAICPSSSTPFTIREPTPASTCAPMSNPPSGSARAGSTSARKMRRRRPDPLRRRFATSVGRTLRPNRWCAGLRITLAEAAIVRTRAGGAFFRASPEAPMADMASLEAHPLTKNRGLHPSAAC